MPTVGVGETDVVYLDLHAMPYTCWQSFMAYIAEHWGIVNVPLLCHGHLKKSSRNVGLTQHLSKLAYEVAYDAW